MPLNHLDCFIIIRNLLVHSSFYIVVISVIFLRDFIIIYSWIKSQFKLKIHLILITNTVVLMSYFSDELQFVTNVQDSFDEIRKVIKIYLNHMNPTNGSFPWLESTTDLNCKSLNELILICKDFYLKKLHLKAAKIISLKQFEEYYMTILIHRYCSIELGLYIRTKFDSSVQFRTVPQFLKLYAENLHTWEAQFSKSYISWVSSNNQVINFAQTCFEVWVSILITFND